MKIRALIVLGAVLGGLAAAPSWAVVADPVHQRFYLMASDGSFYYYTPDAGDPEFDLNPIAVDCGITARSVVQTYACNTSNQGTDSLHRLNFYPAALVTEEIQLSPADPLRFHLDLDVTSPAPYTVHLGLFGSGGLDVASAPAVEVVPGVWEGALTSGSFAPRIVRGAFVRVTTSAEGVGMSLATEGASWIDLPRPVGAFATSDLVARDRVPPIEATSFSTPQRSFMFNDGRWETRSFDSTYSGTQNYPLVLDRDAAAVMAWSESNRTPVLYDILTGSPPPPSKAVDAVTLSIRQGETVIGYSGTSSGRGGGTAAVNVPAGDYQLRALAPVTNQGAPHKIHVLIVYGQRTLRQMRWIFTENGNVFRVSSGTAACGSVGEFIPVTAEVATVDLDLEWDTANPRMRWTPGFDMPDLGSFQCHGNGMGQEVRISTPRARVIRSGAATVRDQVGVATRDTVFTMEADLTYFPVRSEG